MIRSICGSFAAFMAIAVVTTAMAQPTKNAPPPLPPPAPSATPNSDQSNIDIAYGAFQRGFYLTAFNEATKRAQQNDPAAMTLLGELYAQGLGVGRDDSKAAQWYKTRRRQGRSRRHLCAGDVQFPGPRRSAQCRRGRASAGGGRQAWTPERGL